MRSRVSSWEALDRRFAEASANRVSGSGGNGYDPAGTRKDYTGYEKDSETGLEYAQARYYNPTHGRYTSIDPMTASATIKNPQTFNRYSYVLNSPYKFVDPLGLLSVNTSACGGWCPNGEDSLLGKGSGGYPDNYDSGHRAGREGSILEEYYYWQDYFQRKPWESGNWLAAQQASVAIKGASISIFGRTITTGKVSYSGGSVSFEIRDDMLSSDEIKRVRNGSEPILVEMTLALSGNVTELVPTDPDSTGLITSGEVNRKNDSYLEVYEKSGSGSSKPELITDQTTKLIFKGSKRGDVKFSGISGDKYERNATASFMINYKAGNDTKSASIKAIIVGKNENGSHVQRQLRITVTCETCK